MPVAQFGENMVVLQQFNSPRDLGGAGFGCVIVLQQKVQGGEPVLQRAAL